MEGAGEPEVQWDHRGVGVCLSSSTDFIVPSLVSGETISLSRNCTCTQTEVSSAEALYCLFEQIRTINMRLGFSLQKVSQMEKLNGNGVLRIKSYLGSCVLRQQASCKAAPDSAGVGHHVQYVLLQ